MSEWLVVLAIETDETDGHPGRWEWGEILDTPYPVGVVRAVEVTDVETSDAVARLGAHLLNGLNH